MSGDASDNSRYHSRVERAMPLVLRVDGRIAELDRWAADGYRCAVRTASAHQWATLAAGEQPKRAWRERGVLAVRDAGFTEVAPGTVTVAAQWPARS